MLIALLAAIAGPTGVSLGWWLGRRGERERQGREERKSAYVAFVRASIRFRNAADDERREIQGERWAALAEVVLVAPPSVVQAAAYMVSTGDRLLAEPSDDQRLATLRQMWENNIQFTRLARTDLGVGAANPFEGMATGVDERVRFLRPPQV